LITVALPRVRDFRGISPKSFDGSGNFALGLKEQIVFPEIDYDKVSQIRGMNVVICTTAKTDDEARALLKGFQMPFNIQDLEEEEAKKEAKKEDKSEIQDHLAKEAEKNQDTEPNNKSVADQSKSEGEK